MWTLENIFYLLGIIFLVIMLITMIASLIGVWMAVKKVKEFEQELRARLAEKEHTSAGQIVKSVLPLLLSIGLHKTILSKLRR